MWPAERKPGTLHKYWIWVRDNFIRTGSFPAKLGLLHQRVTGGLHCSGYKSGGLHCVYGQKDNRILTGSWLNRVFWKTRTSCPYVATRCHISLACLWVRAYIVVIVTEPGFIVQRDVFPNCLCWLPSCFFTRTRVKLHNTLVYRDIKTYRSNVQTLRFLEKLHSASATHFTL